MQLRTLLLPVGAALVLPTISRAGISDPQAELRYEYFADSDHVHVTGTGGNWAAAFGEDVRLAMDWLREVVVVPGITAAPGSQEAVDSISGASRPIAPSSDPYSDFAKPRQQLDTTLGWRNTSLGYYVSGESDYFAQQVSGAWDRTMFQDNLQLSVSGSFGWDAIQPVEDTDGDTAEDHKNTLHGAFVATQVIDPLTMVQGGVEITSVSGLQHNPYRNVYVDGAYATERHPDSRMRQDAFVKLNRYLSNRSALKMSYKIYNDDWGILSHTLESKLHQYVGNDVIVAYRYRYYTQSAADFQRDDYTEPGGVAGYRTGDYRMGEFSAHLLGTKLSWDLGQAPFGVDWLENVDLDVGYERYFNSNNFSANLFETALAFSF